MDTHSCFLVGLCLAQVFICRFYVNQFTGSSEQHFLFGIQIGIITIEKA